MSKGQLSKEFLSKEIFVQVDRCPRRLLSKEDFSPRRQLHVFLSKEELCFREGFKNIQGGVQDSLKYADTTSFIVRAVTTSFNVTAVKTSCYNKLGCNSH